jgi:topoisomerase IV subunit B
MSVAYSEEHIKTLEWREHIRLRPGMYIGKLGDGSSQDDGVYVLLKEVMDNAIDEYMMGNGKKIDVSITGHEVRIRDFGRGIPLGKLLDAVSKMNTGAKYDSKAFKKSVGLNGVGVKAVNALSSSFIIKSIRDGQIKVIEFAHGMTINDYPVEPTTEENGVEVIFQPDEEMFGNYFYMSEYVDSMLKNYVYLNAGLIINFNGNKFLSRNGLADLLNENMNREGLYPIIHLRGEDIELAFTHGLQYGEDYYSFVNGQNTTQGGSHLLAFKEALVKTIRDFYKKDFDPSDIRSSIIAAISIKVEEPIFESQTKTKLGSKDMGPEGPSVRNFISEFIKKQLDDYLHKNSD